MRTLTTEERKKLLKLAQTASPAPAPPALSPIERVKRSGRLPLSYAQQRLWFPEQMGGLGSTYHIPGRLHLRGELDREALARALDRLVERYEALRTTFSAQSGEPERLPAYMVPSAYVRLEALPLTPNGKLDRKALPAPEDDAFARRGYEAPVGETGQALAEIWSEVLRVDRVGRHDNFFEGGGHSLLIATLIERMRQRGLQAEVGTLFTTRVLAELAAATRRFQEVRI